MTTFAKARDYQNNLYYLAADTEREITDYCESWLPKGLTRVQIDMFNDRDGGLAIEAYIENVTPAVAQKDFSWVGSKRRNPFVVSKPFQYGNKYPEKSFQPHKGGKGG